MIIESPINLELTQLSGQTSQPPWKQLDNSFSEVVLVDDKPVIFNVEQSDNYLNFSFKGDISKKEAISKLKYIYDLDFDLNKFYKYLSNYDELKEYEQRCIEKIRSKKAGTMEEQEINQYLYKKGYK